MGRVSNSKPEEKGKEVKFSSTNNSRKKDRRIKGHIGHRRCTTAERPTCSDLKCNCQFWVFSNGKCFFLHTKHSLIHVNHVRKLPSSSRPLLSYKQKVAQETMLLATKKSSSVAIGMEKNSILLCQDNK